MKLQKKIPFLFIIFLSMTSYGYVKDKSDRQDISSIEPLTEYNLGSENLSESRYSRFSEAYDFFVAEVEFNILEGISKQSREMVFSGLQNLEQLFPSDALKKGASVSPELNRQEAIAVAEKVDILIKDHLIKFSGENLSPEDYYQLARDYQALSDASIEYFRQTSPDANKELRDFVTSKSRVALLGTVIYIGTSIILVGSVIHLSLTGVKDENLHRVVFTTNRILKRCLEGWMKSIWHNRSNVSNFYYRFGNSYEEGLAKFCSPESDDINVYKSSFGSPTRTWRRGRICADMGVTQENCQPRKWLCEKIVEMRACFQAENIQVHGWTNYTPQENP